MLIRWIAADSTTGRWKFTVFAERYERADGSDPTETYHFWIGQNVVASVDKTSGVVVSDSGGRVEGGWISA
jgi:hypothetical protein